MKVGIVSDTHNLLRPEVLAALAGVEMILHAGDVGNPAILAELEEMAPVTAVHGNIDLPSIAPAVQVVEVEGQMIYMLHALADLDINPVSAGVAMVVSGHTHQPGIVRKEGVLYVNPGSCGPRRFRLPVTLALAEVEREGIEVRLVTLV